MKEKGRDAIYDDAIGHSALPVRGKGPTLDDVDEPTTPTLRVVDVEPIVLFEAGMEGEPEESTLQQPFDAGQSCDLRLVPFRGDAQDRAEALRHEHVAVGQPPEAPGDLEVRRDDLRIDRGRTRRAEAFGDELAADVDRSEGRFDWCRRTRRAVPARRHGGDRTGCQYGAEGIA